MTRLERMASSIDWRLQRLETETPGEHRSQVYVAVRLSRQKLGMRPEGFEPSTSRSGGARSIP